MSIPALSNIASSYSGIYNYLPIRKNGVLHKELISQLGDLQFIDFADKFSS